VTSACKQLNDKYGKRGLHFRFVYDRYDSENANLLEIEIVPVPVRSALHPPLSPSLRRRCCWWWGHPSNSIHTQHTTQELGV
jgi:hypothetical protein